MPNGQAHLTPIVILIDGKYYDAASYKASPVPMALESGTVYEALRTGVSQGLFTVGQVRQLKDGWIADGALHAPSPEKPKLKIAPSKAPDEDEAGGPPKLRRSQPATSEPATPAPANSTPPPSSTSSGNSPSAAPETAKADNPTPDIPEISAPEDPNRPMLHRGKSSKSSAAEATKTTKPAAPAPIKSVPKTSTPAKPEASTVQFIPAISDAHPYEPHPYSYDMKPEEEERFRNKMLALAADEVRARDKQLAAEAVPPEAPARPATKASTAKAKSPKLPQPTFADVQLRVFDLSSSNEPTLVLTATAQMPSANGSPERQYFVTLVARNDIYNELHKGFANLTDSQHLDVTSRMDLIDAVDVDGDGRGELLFRQTSESGKGYGIYRVIGDRLYPLYQSSASQ